MDVDKKATSDAFTACVRWFPRTYLAQVEFVAA
jgi:hypothetical protein